MSGHFALCNTAEYLPLVLLIYLFFRRSGEGKLGLLLLREYLLIQLQKNRRMRYRETIHLHLSPPLNGSCRGSHSSDGLAGSIFCLHQRDKTVLFPSVQKTTEGHSHMVFTLLMHFLSDCDYQAFLSVPSLITLFLY